jgi:hypothetical protein
MPSLKQSPQYLDEINDAPIRSSVVRPSSPEFYNPYLFRDGMMPFRPARPYRPTFNPFGLGPYAIAPESRLGAVSLVNLFAQALGVAPTTFTTVTATASGTKTSVVTTTATLMISGCSPPGLAYSTCAASG